MKKRKFFFENFKIALEVLSPTIISLLSLYSIYIYTYYFFLFLARRSHDENIKFIKNIFIERQIFERSTFAIIIVES
jgi:hypothetical protein